jgi:DeoR/GlpR family transcriptional regulator of sugar metabolism
MTTARQQRILAWLREREILSVRELQQHFGVTAMTVWRDLEALRELGLVQRLHGGVQIGGVRGREPGFEEKGAREAAIKARIARHAAREFVREGSVLALEGGTTVAAIVDYLPHRRISVLTNSLLVALRLRTLRPELPVRLVGGWLSPVSGNVTGPEALREIRRLSADVFFLGATAFDAVDGPMDPNPLEIEVKRAWAAAARRTVLLLDARKFGRRSGSITIHARRLHAVVTDMAPPPPFQTMLEAKGVALCLAAPFPVERKKTTRP